MPLCADAHASLVTSRRDDPVQVVPDGWCISRLHTRRPVSISDLLTSAADMYPGSSICTAYFVVCSATSSCRRPGTLPYEPKTVENERKEVRVPVRHISQVMWRRADPLRRPGFLFRLLFAVFHLFALISAFHYDSCMVQSISAAHLQPAEFSCECASYRPTDILAVNAERCIRRPCSPISLSVSLAAYTIIIASA